jgi:hypothetical protein
MTWWMLQRTALGLSTTLTFLAGPREPLRQSLVHGRIFRFGSQRDHRF